MKMARIFLSILIIFILILCHNKLLYSQNYMKKLLIIKGEKDGDYFGGSVAGVGDVNGDGYDDVIIGAPCIDNNEIGYAYVLFGGQNMDNIPDLVFNGEAKDDTFGRPVKEAGDLNNDGSPDFMITAQGYPTVFDSSWGYWHGLQRGRVYVYLGALIWIPYQI